MSHVPLVGFISPPAWYDPSPTEFLRLAAAEVRVQQYVLPLLQFDWRLESVAQTEPDQKLAAQTLGEAGCDLIATVGTPFGWAGSKSVEHARATCARLAEASGVPNVMTGIAVVDALNLFGVRKIGLACTYYSEYWRDLWTAHVAGSGFEVLSACNLADHGLVTRHDTADQDYWAPTPEQTKASVRQIVEDCPRVEAIVVSGAGARTLSFIVDLEDELGIPIVASDSALYWSIARTLNLELKEGVLGRLSKTLNNVRTQH